MVSNVLDLYERCIEFNTSNKAYFYLRPRIKKDIASECRQFAEYLSNIYKKHESTIKKIGKEHIRTLEEIVFPNTAPIESFIEIWEKLEKFGGEEAPKYLMVWYIASLKDLHDTLFNPTANYNDLLHSYCRFVMEREALNILVSNMHLIPKAIEIQKSSKEPLPLSIIVNILYRKGKLSKENMKRYISSLPDECTIYGLLWIILHNIWTYGLI